MLSGHCQMIMRGDNRAARTHQESGPTPEKTIAGSRNRGPGVSTMWERERLSRSRAIGWMCARKWRGALSVPSRYELIAADPGKVPLG